MYQMMNGVNEAVFTLLPMLGRHPDEYPRFRDCFAMMEGKPEYNTGYIFVLTRTGGGNRDSYKDENLQMEILTY